jgi:NADPH2:quinone reductase
MRALRFEKTGSLDELSLQEVPKPTPAAGDVLVQVKAAAINPSDVRNVLGKMHATTVPRIPGRDFAGVVTGGSDVLLGQAVFGSGGNLGFGRDGSHAEFLTFPATAVRPLPRTVSFAQAAAMGVPYLTAWAALVNAAQLQRGETVLITGTAGSVGTIATWIAHHLGARVFGTVRSAGDLGRVAGLPVEAWIDLGAAGLADGVRAVTAGRGVDVAFDLVGGPLFAECLGSLAWRGRQVAVSSSPEPRVGFNLVDFYHNESRLIGVDSLKFSFEECAEMLGSISQRVEAGDLPPPKVDAYPLAQGPELYRAIAAGTVKGKVVIAP